MKMQWKGRIFVVVLACAVLAALSGSVRASQPVWGTRASIMQVGDRLVFSSGDFFTLEGTTVSRRVYRLLRNGTPVLGQVPPARTPPGQRFAGEGVTSYALKPWDLNQRFELEVYGGAVSTYADGQWVEWGGRNAQSGELPNRSEPFVPRMISGRSNSATLVRSEMLEVANAQIRIWRAQGWSERQIARTRIARARAALLR
jgi:hypothetical protein